MNAAFRRTLIHACVIQAFTTSQLATGELSKTWAASGTADYCRFVSKEERFANETKGLQIATKYGMLFPETVTINNKDRVTTITLRRTGASVSADTWEVLEVLPRDDNRGVRHIYCSLERVK